LANGAVAVEAERKIAGRGHGLVYAQRGPSAQRRGKEAER
jgi:hypothetical protein